MVKKKLFAYAVSVLLIGCAPTTSLRFSPEFTNSSIEDATCGVIVCKDRIQILNPEEVDRCLGGGNPVDVFSSFFAEFFPRNLQGLCRFKRIESVQGFDPSGLREKRIERNGKGETWDLMVPVGPKPAPEGVRYLLIFSRITVGGEMDLGSFNMATGSSTLKQASLNAAAIVTLWDAVQGKEVAYGFVGKQAGSQMMISKSTWFELLDGMAMELAMKMRLGKKVI